MSKLKSLENAMHSAVLSLGANTGDPQRQLDEALKAIDTFASVDIVSSLYETEPVGELPQANFLNIAALVRTQLDLMPFHSALKKIEVDLGRTQTVRNGPRPIDIDIIFLTTVSSIGPASRSLILVTPTAILFYILSMKSRPIGSVRSGISRSP